LRLGNEKNEINVVSDQIGSPTYASDLARVIFNIIFSDSFNKKSFPTEIYHFSNLGVTSWYEFAKEIFNLANLDCKIKPIGSKKYPAKALRPYNTALNKEKITKKFKLQIPSWQESLRDLLIKIS